MITWVTVWVLTVTRPADYTSKSESNYQFTYATEAICKRQGERITGNTASRYSCNFQQVPIYRP